MKQSGLIQCIIEAVGLDDGTVKVKFTPKYQRPLFKDVVGSPPIGMFGYSSVVGMIIYLLVNTRPYKAFSVNCCSR